MEDLTKIAMEVAELRAENKILKYVNDRLLQALPIHGVVAGGGIKKQNLSHEKKAN